MAQKKVIVSKRGPKAKGPYSAAVAFDGLLFVSGQVPVDPDTGKVVGDSVEEQVVRAFENLRLILEDAGSSLDHVLKITLYLGDMGHFVRANEVYQRFFTEGNYPARTTIQAGRLPFDVLVEIDAIAQMP
ncbi:MAG: Rid family detoxifying hydrolase [Candidatus Latescibacterota bacterium]